MWLPVLGLIIGVILGLMTDIKVPDEYSNYLSIAVLLCIGYSIRRDSGTASKHL